MADLDGESGSGGQIRAILRDHFQDGLELAHVEGRGLGLEEVKRRLEAALRKYSPEVGFLILDEKSLEFGSELLGSFRNGHMPPVIAVAPFDRPSRLLELREHGVADFTSSPVNAATLIARVSACLPTPREDPIGFMREFNARIAPLKFITRNASMIVELQKLVRFAAADETILLTGETGTGKEILAHAAHRLSGRAGGPFVVVDCPNLPETLAESMLFGHVKGAFTGATEAHKGMLMEADGGTVFLDEINSIKSWLQPKLLRVLATGEIHPVGSAKRVKVDVRFISASNGNLEELVRAGEFREDLWHRLNVLPIAVPPLRKRLEDVPALTAEFLAARQRGISPSGMNKLLAQRWRGNVRELKDLLTRAVALSPRPVIEADAIQTGPPTVSPIEESLGGKIKRVAARAVEAALEEHLSASGWNLKKAAREGEMDPSQLRALLRKHGLEKPV